MKGDVVDLAEWKEQRTRQEALRAIRRARLREMPVPDKLVDDVLGPDDALFSIAERLERATGLRWPRPGSITRLLAEFVRSEGR